MNRKVLLTGCMALGLILVACGGGESSSSNKPTTTPSTSSSSSSSSASYPEGYVQDSGVGQKNYIQTNSQEYAVKLSEELEEEGTRCLDSVGEKQLLVIPVEFPDFPAENLNNQGDKELARQYIEKGFFGETEETGWESLRSYYYKSSYGKLTLNGLVTDWFMLDKTIPELLEYWKTVSWADGGNGGYNSSWYILREAIKWYKTNSEAKGWPDIKNFDQDGDGIIDGVWLVNSAGITAYNSHDFWAYTYWDMNNPAAVNGYDPEDPIAVPYCFASIKFMETSGYDGPDMHTMIHESGHLMGIEDYYTYDEGSWGPAGGGDMMDMNVGDHDAYSKTLYGWTNPYYVTGDAEITIKPFQENGDCIIVNNNWNGHGFDEYLIIEYYTPTGLNEKDASEPYKGSYPQLPTKAGLKIYHIDARLGVFDVSALNNSNKTKKEALLTYTDEIVKDHKYNGKTVVTTLAHSNTRSRSAEPNNSLIHLLEATGRNSFKENKKISNTTLFKEGATFGYKKFENYKFNDGTYLDYIIEVKSITDEGATIVFNAKQK